MIYRDQLERCPRCGVDLISAGSVRACPQCQGHWVTIEVLREMAEAMVMPPRPVSIRLIPDRRDPLQCPSCEKPMETWMLHEVPIDRCGPHGLWFDRAELQSVLFRTGTAGQATPAEEDVRKLADSWDSLPRQ
jgi:Zn-finger nucleic acid-binding protein